MKIKHVLVLLSIIVMTGCATVVGANFDDYVKQVGVPNGSYQLQNGNTLYSYQKPCKYYPNEMHDYTIEVDSQNKIVKKTEKKTCRVDLQKQKEERESKGKVMRVLDDLFPGYED